LHTQITMSIESQQQQVQSWIESVTGTPISGDLPTALKDGVVLCNVINSLRPDTITSVNKYNAAFRQMQNIDNFLKVAEKLGVPDKDRFKTEDLFYGNNFPQVLVCLISLSQVAGGKFGSNAISTSGLDDLRSHASGSQREGGKVREIDSGLSIFETGMKKAQKEASKVNRTNDRMIRKDMQEHAATSELGFIDSDKAKHQALASGAHMSGQDLIIRSKDVAVSSSELGFIDSDKNKHQLLASQAHGRGMDQIIRSKDDAISTSELGFIDSDKAKHQALASQAHGRGMDQIIRSKDEAAVSSELGFIDSDKAKHQALASQAHGRGMDQIIRTDDVGSSDVNYVQLEARDHQKMISEARSEKLDKIIKQGVDSDINYDD